MGATVPKLLVIVGETASGKSELAMQLAQNFNGEIIAADSWTVYKGFDIGTAKPTLAEQQRVTHHLLNIADPLQGFSAAEFKKQAIATIQAVANRARLPILVGGTGLYVDSVVFDYGFLPAGSPGERQRLNSLTLDELLQEATRLKLDMTGIDRRNKRRLIRLIETKGQRPSHQTFRPNTLMIGLQVPAAVLEARISARVDAMFDQGLEEEVKGLMQRYGWGVEPMKGIGYREFREYFEGQQTLEQTKEAIVRASIQLAKKQRTWFKRNKSIHWLQDSQQALPVVQNFLSK